MRRRKGEYGCRKMPESAIKLRSRPSSHPVPQVSCQYRCLDKGKVRHLSSNTLWCISEWRGAGATRVTRASEARTQASLPDATGPPPTTRTRLLRTCHASSSDAPGTTGGYFAASTGEVIARVDDAEMGLSAAGDGELAVMGSHGHGPGESPDAYFSLMRAAVL